MNNANNTISGSELLEGMRNLTLDPKFFDHEAHVKLGWLLIKENGLENAIHEVSQLIKTYAEHLGATNKYHETVTRVSMLLIDERMTDRDQTFEEFIDKHPELLNNFMKLVASKYSFDVFASELARIEFIEPDR